MRFSPYIVIAISFLIPHSVQGQLVTFDEEGIEWNDGLVTIGGNMEWNDIGGPHVFANNWNDDDFIYFAAPQKVNDWQMSNQPFEDFEFGDSFLVTVELRSSANQILWSSAINLEGYDWENPFTVEANVENVSSMTFFSTMTVHGSRFFPSVDNIRLNDVGAVPEPGAMVGLGAMALGLVARRRRK